MSARKKEVGSLVSPSFQIVLMTITSIVLAILVTQRSMLFRPTDDIPNLEILTPARLASLGGLPEVIKVGLYIESFSEFDPVKNEFVVPCVVWFVLNPGIIPLDTLSKFSIKRGSIIERSLPNTKLLDDRLLVTYNTRLSFSSPFDYSDFPLDDHYVSIVIVNNFISPTKALFETTEDSFILDPASKIYGWDLVGRQAFAGYVSTPLAPDDSRMTSQVIAAAFTIGYSFVGSRFVTSILVPLMIIFFIALFCFTFTQDDTRINVSVGVVSALLAYRFVIETISPKIGYFMFSDYLFFMVLASVFVIFFVSILDLFGITIPSWVKKIIICSIHLIFLAMSWYLLF